MRNAIVISEYVDIGGTGRRSRLMSIPLDGGNPVALTTPAAQSYDWFATISPDGRTVAFARAGDLTTSIEHLYLLPLDTQQQSAGPERPVGPRLQSIRGLAWAPDGRSLFVSSRRKGTHKITRISISDGSETSAGVGMTGTGALSVAAVAHRMAFVIQQQDSDILRAPGPGWTTRDGPAPEPEPVIASIYNDVSPNYSPDGKRIAYDSEASGYQEIWVADADGRNAQQLTSANGTPVGTPRWSPDGTMIAYDSRQFETGDIFVINARGGAPRRLTMEPSSEYQPVWSSDGKYIYFESDRNGNSAIWKVPSGGGTAVQVTPNGSGNVRRLNGTDWLYYDSGFPRSRNGTEVWRVREHGGEREQVATGVPFRAWTPYHGGIVRFNATAIEISPDFSGKWSLLRKLPRGLSPRFFRSPLITITADDKWLAFPVSTVDRSDLMLVDGLN